MPHFLGVKSLNFLVEASRVPLPWLGGGRGQPPSRRDQHGGGRGGEGLRGERLRGRERERKELVKVVGRDGMRDGEKERRIVG